MNAFSPLLLSSVFTIIWLLLTSSQTDRLELSPVYARDYAVVIMKQAHVVFAGTGKDVAKYIPKLLFAIDRASEKFASSHVVIYENDSIDETRMLIQEHARGRANFTFIFEDGITMGSRTGRIAHGRNKLLEAVRSLNIPEPSYLVMLDMDNVNSRGLFVDSMETCFQYKNWDALFANQKVEYYDIYALRETGDLDFDYLERVSYSGDEWSGFNRWERTRPIQDSLVPVISAFGGIGIYRLAAIPAEARYSGSAGSEAICEHVPFHESLKKHGFTSLFINTQFKNY